MSEISVEIWLRLTVGVTEEDLFGHPHLNFKVQIFQKLAVYQSSKWKFEFTGPNQILEFILYINFQMYIYLYTITGTLGMDAGIWTGTVVPLGSCKNICMVHWDWGKTGVSDG
jgi:hypothetical protein